MIKADEFKQRLEVLCLKGGGRGLPRRPRDRHILFKSLTLMLDGQAPYTETEINQHIEQWLAEVGQTLEIDHVSLRRHLVDEGYLHRDQAGTTYRVSVEGLIDRFDSAIETIDPVVLLVEARERLERKKKAYLKNK